MMRVDKSPGITPTWSRQSRRVVTVRGLPSHLSRDDIEKYFQTCGVISYVFREGMAGFKGTCRITYKEESGARNAVLRFHKRKFSYGHIMSVSMAVGRNHSTIRRETARPGDWVCTACSHHDFDCINFDWQQQCFSCGGQRPAQVLANTIKEEQEERVPDTNIEMEEDDDDDDEEEEEVEATEKEYKVEDPGEIIPPAAKQAEAPWRDPELEMEDVLLNTFMNHSAFSDNLPLQVNIKVSRPGRGSELDRQSKYLHVSLSINDEMISQRLKENFSFSENADIVDPIASTSTNLPDLRVRANAVEEEPRNPTDVQNDETIDCNKENDVIGERNVKSRKTVFSSYEDDYILKAIRDGKKDTKEISEKLKISHGAVVKRIQTLQKGLEKGKKKFTYNQDKEIIDKVIEILPGKSLQTLDIPEEILSVLSVAVSRSESSVSARWRGKLRKWLVQFYSHNRNSWKQLRSKACQKRREDISRYFKLQAKKKGLTYHGLMMNVEKKK